MDYPETKQKLWQYSKGISFDESSHTYYYKNRTLASVTTLVGYNFPKFDSKNEVSGPLADKRGISVKELKQEWRDKADLGTKVHNELECLVFSGEHIYNIDTWVDDRVLQGFNFLSPVLSGNEVFKFLYPEFPVYDGEYSVAGTCDLLVWNPITQKIDIYDWKTNDTIMDESVNFGKFGFGRLSHIPDTNFWKYALQLSVYKYLLEKAGFEVGGLYLVHLTDSDYKVIELPYLSDESLVILESNL